MSIELGWGTHRVPQIIEAARSIVTAGCDWIDTAPNYARGGAHAALAPILAAHPHVAISTKVGFLPRALAADALAAGVIDNEAAAKGHSIEANYIHWQTERAQRELGRGQIDVMFLHNPEECHTDRTELGAAITEAFAALEAAAFERRIAGYGVATWSGFEEGAFTVAELLAFASRAAGGQSHHLIAVQLPVNLIQVEPAAAALEGKGPLVHATEAGLSTFVSAPLHGGELPSLIDQELADLVAPGLTPSQAALAILGGTPGIDRVLISTSNTAHWDEACQAVKARVARSTVRKVIDVLSA